MLSRCANSQCSKRFLKLHQGKLFLVETECETKSGEPSPSPSPCTRQPPRRVERYWLCEECARTWTLVHDRLQGIVLVPLPRPPAGVRPIIAMEYGKTARPG
jgi:hypothetical protein